MSENEPTPSAASRRLSRVSVLVDATSIPHGEGGVARYLRGLASGFADLPDTGVDLSIVCQGKDADWITAALPDADVRIGPSLLARTPLRLLWEQFGLPRLAARLGVDVVHSPHYTLPLFRRGPVVVTIHDATFFTHPELHGRLKGPFFRGWSRISARRAAAIVVPSAATRDEFSRETRPVTVPMVAHHGVSESFAPPAPADIEVFRSQHGLGDHPFVAFLGTMEPRKNVPALVTAFGHIADRANSPDDSPLLLLAGGAGWDTTIGDAIQRSGHEAQIIDLGYLPENQLTSLLGGADVVAYPSLGEGFGLPVLEAMACGAAVLTTRMLALPEVGGDAVAYSGTSSAELETALGELLDDAPRRAQLARAAVDRAAEFTWARCAAIHADVYRSAAAQGADR